MDVITTLTYLATGKMQLCSSDDLGLLQHLLCCCSFPIKYVKYDSMVNKEYVYIYSVCGGGGERESEREYGKTGKFAPVISKRKLIIDPTLKSALLFPSWTTNQSQSSKDCHS